MINLTPEEFFRLLNAAQGLTPQELVRFDRIGRSQGIAALGFTVQDTARVLHLERTSIWRYTEDGILKKVEVLPRHFLYPREEVLAFPKVGYKEVLHRRMHAG